MFEMVNFTISLVIVVLLLLMILSSLKIKKTEVVEINTNILLIGPDCCYRTINSALSDIRNGYFGEPNPNNRFLLKVFEGVYTEEEPIHLTSYTSLVGNSNQVWRDMHIIVNGEIETEEL